MTDDCKINNIFACSCGNPSLMNSFLKIFNSPLGPSPKNVKPNNISDDNNKRQSLNLQAKVKDEFLHYCYNSTIRGVPRIAKSRNRPMRILWIISFVSLLLGFSSCVYLLGRQFSEYNVIHPPRVLTDAESDFPSVTICNSRPLSLEGKKIIKDKNWRKPNEFTSIINKWAIKEYYNKGRRNDYFLTTPAMQLSSYLESLPTEKDRKSLGHQLKNFVIYCQITYLNGSKGIAYPCDRIGSWTDYIHAFYINCYTYNLKVQYRKMTKTMEVYLYLEEDMNEINCPDCMRYDIKSQISGAVLAIDRPETFSNINEKGISLMPGTLTEIRLKTFENIRITPPYGRCSENTPKKLKMFDKEFVYSEKGCKQATIQIDFERECKCVAIEYPYNTSRLPFCGQGSAFINKNECSSPSKSENSTCIKILDTILENMRCKEQITQRYYRDYIENCTMPCSFLSYESDRSTSMWPAKSFQIALIDKGVFKENNIISKPEFEPYRKIKELIGKGMNKEAAKLLDNTNVLERNLVAVLLIKPNFNLHKVEEKAVLSLTSFLSQIGGLCSIWIGLTMISIVEMFELIMQLFIVVTSNRKAKSRLKYKENLDQTWTYDFLNPHCVNPSNSKSSNDSFCKEDQTVKENNCLPHFHQISVFNSGILKCQKCNEENTL